ncbi:MAG: dihydropteroate synthase [Lachnospiraceae bacterium]|nr:dihydropteroate synthase [Lachnospiraceae bacterium]
MKIGAREFDIKGKTYVMGILNVTPDSFSDGGKFNQMDAALFHVEEMIKEGMDVVDIGGESTRPGYTPLSEDEEISRIVPVIEQVRARFDIPISLDTYKSKVASAGIAAGADMINDIWGLKYDGNLAKVIADAGIPCSLMHNRKESDYTDYIQNVLEDLVESVQTARLSGIADEKILLDPGIGFGKTYENNLEIMNKLEILHSFGYPLLVGASRKSVIGITLDLPVTERLEGTLVTTVIATMKGAMFVRVHDVKENVRAIRMTEAIVNK